MKHTRPNPSAHRFFCPDLADTIPGTVFLEEDQAHHALRVMRLRAGDAVEVFNGNGIIGQGVIETTPVRVAVRVTHTQQVPAPQPTIIVAAPLPKGPRSNDMINQLSQVGADVYVPLLTQRSVTQTGESRHDRLARVAVESAKQCGRAYLMRIEDPQPLRSVLEKTYSLKLIATPPTQGRWHEIDAVSGSPATGSQRVLILIGPEGGWTEDEARSAEAAGCVPWTISPNILRIEAAAAAATSLARYLLRERSGV